MLADLIVPLVTIGLAELGDKSQLSILLLSSKTKRHFQLLVGVMLAFLIADGLAVAAGAWIGNAVPVSLLRIASAAVFIAFGLIMLMKKEKENAEDGHSKNAFMSGFLLIFIAELGDKTQLATGLFAAKYNAIFVLAGVMIALLLLSITAIYAGKIAAKKISRKKVSKISGILFILIGLSFLLFN